MSDLDSLLVELESSIERRVTTSTVTVTKETRCEDTFTRQDPRSQLTKVTGNRQGMATTALTNNINELDVLLKVSNSSLSLPPQMEFCILSPPTSQLGWAVQSSRQNQSWTLDMTSPQTLHSSSKLSIGLHISLLSEDFVFRDHFYLKYSSIHLHDKKKILCYSCNKNLDHKG